MTDRVAIANLMKARSEALRRAAIEWLCANDPNGCYTDEQTKLEGLPRTDVKRALALVLVQLEDT